MSGSVNRTGAQLMRMLIGEGLLSPGVTLVWPRRREVYSATVMNDGSMQLADGRRFRSPSGAATGVANGVAYNGWILWRVGTEDGPLLSELRERLKSRPARVEPEEAGR